MQCSRAAIISPPCRRRRRQPAAGARCERVVNVFREKKLHAGNPLSPSSDEHSLSQLMEHVEGALFLDAPTVCCSSTISLSSLPGSTARMLMFLMCMSGRRVSLMILDGVAPASTTMAATLGMVACVVIAEVAEQGSWGAMCTSAANLHARLRSRSHPRALPGPRPPRPPSLPPASVSHLVPRTAQWHINVPRLIHVAARSGLVTTRKRRLFFSPLNFPQPEPQWLYLFMKTTLRLESIRSPPTLVSLSGRPVFGSLRVKSATACLWSMQITPSTLRSVSPTEIPALNTSPWVTTFSTCEVRAGFHARQSVAISGSQMQSVTSGCIAP